jgi:hypothetical protein
MREIIIFQLNSIQIAGENLDAHDCVIQKNCERSFGILTFFLPVVLLSPDFNQVRGGP